VPSTKTIGPLSREVPEDHADHEEPVSLRFKRMSGRAPRFFRARSPVGPKTSADNASGARSRSIPKPPAQGRRSWRRPMMMRRLRGSRRLKSPSRRSRPTRPTGRRASKRRIPRSPRRRRSPRRSRRVAPEAAEAPSNAGAAEVPHAGRSAPEAHEEPQPLRRPGRGPRGASARSTRLRPDAAPAVCQ